tara:strand:+ start:2024 stop:2329 length:306 start_codon:yes stop_codon:yes gene_type:complete
MRTFDLSIDNMKMFNAVFGDSNELKSALLMQLTSNKTNNKIRHKSESEGPKSSLWRKVAGKRIHHTVDEKKKKAKKLLKKKAKKKAKKAKKAKKKAKSRSR